MNELRLYKVLSKYVEALRNKDNGGDETAYRVDKDKENRPFVGIITFCNGRNYFIPLTTPRERIKYLTAKEPDYTPIYRKGQLLAGIEFNKMIPVPLNQVRELDIESREHDSRSNRWEKERRRYEIVWCNKHAEEIVRKAEMLYRMRINNDPSYKNIAYCLNFPALEAICDEYEKNHPKQH